MVNVKLTLIYRVNITSRLKRVMVVLGLGNRVMSIIVVMVCEGGRQVEIFDHNRLCLRLGSITILILIIA